MTDAVTNMMNILTPNASGGPQQNPALMTAIDPASPEFNTALAALSIDPLTLGQTVSVDPIQLEGLSVDPSASSESSPASQLAFMQMMHQGDIIQNQGDQTPSAVGTTAGKIPALGTNMNAEGLIKIAEAAVNNPHMLPVQDLKAWSALSTPTMQAPHPTQGAIQTNLNEDQINLVEGQINLVEGQINLVEGQINLVEGQINIDELTAISSDNYSALPTLISNTASHQAGINSAPYDLDPLTDPFEQVEALFSTAQSPEEILNKNDLGIKASVSFGAETTLVGNLDAALSRVSPSISSSSTQQQAAQEGLTPLMKAPDLAVLTLGSEAKPAQVIALAPTLEKAAPLPFALQGQTQPFSILADGSLTLVQTAESTKAVEQLSTSAAQTTAAQTAQQMQSSLAAGTGHATGLTAQGAAPTGLEQGSGQPAQQTSMAFALPVMQAMAMTNKAAPESFSSSLKALSSEAGFKLENDTDFMRQIHSPSTESGMSKNGNFGQQHNQAALSQQMPLQQTAAFKWASDGATTVFADSLFNEQSSAFGSISSGMNSMNGLRSDGFAGTGFSTSTPTLTQQALGHHAANQVGLAVTKAANAQNNQFNISLRPAELGAVKVSLTFIKDGSVQARILAERPETLDMLQKDSRSIERILEQSGHKVSRSSLEFDLDEQKGQSAGKTWAEAVQKESMEHQASGDSKSDSRSLNDQDIPWPEEEEISLDDILPYVTAETGLDIRI
ncbi:flagellar hook-length control protein FliK [Temperatibacter marinus]|uniref:Flagellar hook-length control protein FliK n=1 Tax=Temperatibacter marinus TaxID=1456591 RepID=A0AA52EGJ7_9PROT|nr:flagellar hook-length control protein FliK [Temperatibacter marinus]WND02733.1 flagellar hook-length control protein FliK [Temperatibacter marinus]